MTCTNIIFLFSISAMVGSNILLCSAVSEEQESYTEAVLNITYCKRFYKDCGVKPFDTRGIFGEHSPIRAVSGWLFGLPDRNVNGCVEFSIGVNKRPWIALIKRGSCNFVEKIKNAQKHNATAAIIFDYEDSRGPVKMLHSDADSIVAVSITKALGEVLGRALVNQTHAVFVDISVGKSHDDPPRGWQVNPTSVLFVSVSFIVLMVISLAWLVFYYVQRFRYVHARDKTEKRLTSAAKKAIAKLPTRTVSKKTEEDESDNCAVCLDGYKASDAIRILPCQHEFHKLCIDPWLIEHRTCPMCKLNILKELGVGGKESRTPDVEVAEVSVQADHHTAADNQGVIVNDIEPSVSERRTSSDAASECSSGGSGRVLHVSAEVNWERDDQSTSSTSNLVDPPSPDLRAYPELYVPS
ncbi:RING finger protein 150-like [Montipora foliosa]|uniref:RING finger protein 150-like n=1 Tax=Montipora foliosa TaxID=591990 RepID=UPI0035F1AEAE